MGHSEAVHASRYLVEERAEHKLAYLLRQRDLDEGRNPESKGAEASATAGRRPAKWCQSLSSAPATPVLTARCSEPLGGNGWAGL